MSITGRADRNGLELWVAVEGSARITAKPSQIAGDIVLTLGQGVGGSDLILQIDERKADEIVDRLVDALEAARAPYSKESHAD
jgi:hypothetical protein